VNKMPEPKKRLNKNPDLPIRGRSRKANQRFSCFPHKVQEKEISYYS